MAILETIAAANAAYSVIRTCIANGRETADLMSNVGKFLTAEEELKDAVQRKKNSPITAITGGAEGDWEEFQQLEKIREQRKARILQTDRYRKENFGEVFPLLNKVLQIYD